jgi:hypothetical protein
VEEARALDVVRCDERDERAMLAARVGLLGDLEVARAREVAARVRRHRRGQRAVLPRGEAVLLLRGIDHLAARERERGHGGEDEDGSGDTNHSASSW